MMRFAGVLVLMSLALGGETGAHAGMGAPTWNREISRIVFDRCVSCHRPEGGAFSLLSYQDAQPRATAIKEAVLTRRMPPWGAVKGFGQFSNDTSLSQEQIELITRWVDGGIRRGNNPRQLPAIPPPVAPARFEMPARAVVVTGSVTLQQPMLVAGLFVQHLGHTGGSNEPPYRSARISAASPGGAVQPLVWLHEYDPAFAHPFWLRQPRLLPAGTTISGLPPDMRLALLPATSDK